MKLLRLKLTEQEFYFPLRQARCPAQEPGMFNCSPGTKEFPSEPSITQRGSYSPSVFSVSVYADVFSQISPLQCVSVCVVRRPADALISEWKIVKYS